MAKKKKAETALQNYVNDAFGKIRAMLIEGVPYFVGKDVAKALGYTNSGKALRDHVDDEDKMVNESGMYSLILSSKLPTAKKI